MTTGERIKAARKSAGMTQKELADCLGISYVNISQYENGKRNPKYETVQRIADALGINVMALLDFPSAEIQALSKAWSGLAENEGDIAKLESIAFEMADRIDNYVSYNESQANFKRITEALELLNESGQTVAVERVEELTEIPKYQKTLPSEESQDEDK